jgi:hypothetical protein
MTIMLSKGMAVTEFIPHLLNLHKEVATLEFAAYRVAPGLSGRLQRKLSRKEAIAAQFVEKFLIPTDMPFNIDYFLEYIDSLIRSPKIVNEALRHDKRNEKTLKLERNEVNARTLSKMAKALEPGFVLALCSRARLSTGDTAHIPMIDFRCHPSEDNASATIEILKEIGEKQGVLLNSGRSFHYYGMSLLSEREWQAFLGKFLLLSPIVDSRYIAHRLIDGFCRLRISETSIKPKIPEVIRVLK